MTIANVQTSDQRILRTWDSWPGGEEQAQLTIIWFHGSPQTGAPLDPILHEAGRRAIRVLSYGRPSYGGSTALADRTVASAAADVLAIADAAGASRFVVMGASGGGPHALACAALLPHRVIAAICFATLAPLGADGLDWYSGMAGGGPALRAAEAGRAARESFEETAEFDPSSFVQVDYDALAGPWTSLGRDVDASGE